LTKKNHKGSTCETGFFKKKGAENALTIVKGGVKKRKGKKKNRNGNRFIKEQKGRTNEKEGVCGIGREMQSTNSVDNENRFLCKRKKGCGLLQCFLLSQQGGLKRGALKGGLKKKRITHLLFRRKKKEYGSVKPELKYREKTTGKLSITIAVSWN